jgi:hypothetical protein
MALGLSPLSAAEETLLEDALPCLEQRMCLLCRLRRETTASCEQDKRVIEVLQRRRVRPLTLSRPPCVVVCKDCCIAALGGHGCLWWDLCWRDQESRRGSCEVV